MTPNSSRPGSKNTEDKPPALSFQDMVGKVRSDPEPPGPKKFKSPEEGVKWPTGEEDPAVGT